MVSMFVLVTSAWVFLVLNRIVKKVDSSGLVVLMFSQWSVGKSYKTNSSPRSLSKQLVVLGYLSCQVLMNRSNAFSAFSLVSAIQMSWIYCFALA